MKNPHEEEWVLTSDGMIALRSGKVVLRPQGSASGPESTRLACTAPELARALIAVRRPASRPACWCPLGYDTEEGHTMQCDNARNTLRRAGVPLP